jgi:hypothetical protein
LAMVVVPSAAVIETGGARGQWVVVVCHGVASCGESMEVRREEVRSMAVKRPGEKMP